MARIPEQEVERLKKEISVQRLAEAQGVKLTRHGADLVGKCPFHDDRTPSLVITPAKNLWHCLGACNADGNFAGVKDKFAVLEGGNAGSKQGQNGGVAGGARGDESPVSIVVKGSFYENEQKNTVGEETEDEAIVAALHRNNGSRKGGW